MQLNEESDFSKVTVKQEEGWSNEKVEQEASDCSQVPHIKPDIMEVDPLEEHYTECADDIKSAEFVEERSDKACEQPTIKEDAEDIKFINTQDYLDIGDTVVSEWNKAAPSVATALDIKPDIMEVDPLEEHYTECADDIKSAEFVEERSDKACEQPTIKEDAEDIKFINTQDYLDIGDTVVSEWNKAAPSVATALGFIKEEHTDPDDAEIIAHEEKIRELILNKIEVRHGTTSLKTEEEINADTTTSVKTDVAAVASWRVILHRLPTDTLQLSTALSGDAVRMNINASYNDNENENRQLKDALQEGTNKFDEITATYFVSNQPPITANETQKKYKKNMTYESSDFKSLHESLLKVQMRRHTIETLYKCETCDFKCTQSGTLKKHMRTHTGEKPFKCETCDFKCTQSGTLKDHMRRHTGEKPYKCETCEFKCTQSGTLKTHMLTHSAKKTYKCETCEFKCTQSGTLKTHMLTHSGKKPYKCETCDYKSAWASHLKDHMRRHTGEKPYKCETCEFKCTQSGTLRNHMRTHSGKKPYKCETCDYKGARASNLKNHMRRHTGEKPYKCETCEFKCTESGTLKKHMLTHSGEKPYKCETCDFKCIQSAALKTHMLSHTGEKPFKCETCDFKCTQSSHMKRHMRTHTGEKPYKCETCDYKSARASHLKEHLRRHTGEKLYKCKTCEFKCAQSGTLKTHMRTHTGEKPFQM